MALMNATCDIIENYVWPAQCWHDLNWPIGLGLAWLNSQISLDCTQTFSASSLKSAVGKVSAESPDAKHGLHVEAQGQC